MWNRKPRVGLVVTYAPLEVGCEDAPRLKRRALSALKALPVELVACPRPVCDLPSAIEAAHALEAADVDAVIWLAATWAFDNWALEFLRLCRVPLIAWGTPGMATGSLCGSQQLNEVLHELELEHGFVHGALDDPRAHAAILAFVQGAAAAQRLSLARFGMLGHRTIGMTEVAFHEYDLFEQFGALVYHRGIDRLTAKMREMPLKEARALWASVKARCGQCRIPADCGIEAMRCYLALRDWIARDQLDGVAVGCYPDLMGIVRLGCGLLAEEGIPTACEGDMNSLVLAAAMQLISGRPVHNTDLLSANEEDDTCTLSHCGNSAISLAAQKRDVVLDRVRLMDRGVVTMYPGAPGRVTMANLCGRKGSYRLTCYTGEAVPTAMTFPGIPVKIRLDVPMDHFLDETAAFGAGHHWIVAYGEIAEALAAFAAFTRLESMGASAHTGDDH